MKNIIATSIVLSLLGITAASAQGAGTPAAKSPPSSESQGSRMGDAPVGHRQPRATDVPSASEKNYKESPEDQALDRKIKSICRGC